MFSKFLLILLLQSIVFSLTFVVFQVFLGRGMVVNFCKKCVEIRWKENNFNRVFPVKETALTAGPNLLPPACLQSFIPVCQLSRTWEFESDSVNVGKQMHWILRWRFVRNAVNSFFTAFTAFTAFLTLICHKSRCCEFLSEMRWIFVGNWWNIFFPPHSP